MRHVATFKFEHDGTTFHETLPVVAWESGEPLVVHGNELVAPRSVGGIFTGVSEEDEPVGVPPAGGWRARWTDDDGSTHSEPIVGWFVESGGFAKAIIREEGAEAAPAEHLKNVEVYHPDAE